MLLCWKATAKWFTIVTLGLLLGPAVSAPPAQAADQPLMGFDGELVDLPPGALGGGDIKGMEVRSVRRRSPAASMGLERGDIVVNIDAWSFKSRAGYLAALRQASESPSVILINVRNGKLTRKSCSLPHDVDQNQHPDTVRLAIDLARDMQR